MDKIKLREIIVVEGKYDFQKLVHIVDTTVICTNGFRIFKDKSKVNLISKLADKHGVIILTDSDDAGLVIRNFLKGVIPNDKIRNIYIPQIIGKERRKASRSKQGFLGVEGIDDILLIKIFNDYKSMYYTGDYDYNKKRFKKSDMFSWGILGRDGSSILRKKILEYINLPTNISTNLMLEYFNIMYTEDEIKGIIDKIGYSD